MESQKAWVGIDPGATGALAVITGSDEVFVYDWPGDERALNALMVELRLRFRVQLAIIEAQQAMPGQGVSSTFKLGVNFGMWMSAIAARDWPVRALRPSVWKNGLGYPAGDQKGSKGHSLTLARRLYPAASDCLARKMDHNRAEAILLAHTAKGGKF